eukprot:3225465-Alexandrium_andersonii.AAC.1
MNVLKIVMKHLVTKHKARRTSQSQHMKRSATLLLPFSHEVSPLSQQGGSRAEVISKDVSARSASAACSDAEKWSPRCVRHTNEIQQQ